jgi:HSP20 family protein
MKTSFKHLSNHKFTFAVLGFLLGLSTYWGVSTLRQHQVWMPSQVEDPFAELFTPMDPFKELTRMQQRLFADAPMIENVAAPASLKVEEDEGHIVYNFAIPDLTHKNIQVRVEDGYVVLQGKSEKSNEASDQRSFFTSSFHQSYPWPQGVRSDLDSTKVKIKYEQDRIRVEFPKEDGANGYT